jgi:energy-coupling factor transport system ATP-binding protein
MSVITVENLRYRYPHTKELALDGLDFSVEKGEFIGIIGENGAGKSTLSQAIMGLVPQFYKGAYGGMVTVDGIEAGKTPVAQLCGHVGLVFQNPFNQLSGAKDNVYEEVAFGMQNLGVPAEEMKKRVEEALKLLDIWQYRDRNPFDLSGGQMQRVAIASVLVMRPDVMILDEPTSQLDPEGSDEVFRAVETLTGSGITILMIEQKIEKLAAYCDRILLLHKGKQIAFDTPQKVFSMPDLNDYGIQAPAFTRICKAEQVTLADGTYPVTVKEAAEVLREKRLGVYEHANAEAGVQKAVGASAAGTGQVQAKNAETGARSGQSGTCRKAENVASVDKQFRIEKLDFSYLADIPVLEDLNMKLDQRPTAIIGQNGAGKTTLVKLLKGLLKPVSGSIYFHGEDISGKTVAMLAGSVGYVFQNPDDQIFKYNVMDEILFGPLNIGMDPERAKKEAARALELTGLSGKEKENPYDLELYERKMTAIASVLAMDTDVLILDEPTIAQDWKGRQIIGSIIRSLSGRGKLDVTLNKPGLARKDEAGEKILARLQKQGGFLPVGDKSSPELIYSQFSMSKGTFKKAIGGLFKQGLITIESDGIRLV